MSKDGLYKMEAASQSNTGFRAKEPRGKEVEVPKSKWRPRAGVLKVQVSLNAHETLHIERRSCSFGVSNAAVVKGALGLFAWCCKQVSKGYDVGAYNRETGHFVAVDVPYSDEIDFSITPVEVEEKNGFVEAAEMDSE